MPSPPPVCLRRLTAGVNGARQGDALQNKTETASAKPATHQRQKEAAQAMSAQPAHARKQEAAPADKDAPSETAKAEDGKATVSIASPGPEQRDTASGGPAPARPAAPIPAPKSMYQTTPQPVFRGAPMRRRRAPLKPCASSGQHGILIRDSSRVRRRTPLTASLEGTVHDASGTAVKNAAIDIVNNATNAYLQHVTPFPSVNASRFSKFVRATTRAKQTLHGDRCAGAGVQEGGADGHHAGGESTCADRYSAPSGRGVANRRDPGIREQRATESVQFPAPGGSSRFRERHVPESIVDQRAADLLSSQLDDSGQVRVIDREKVQQAQQAQAQSRPPSAKQAADLGRRLGADAVIVGTVKAPATGNSNIAVTAQVIDTKKARAMSKVAANGASLQGATNSLGLALRVPTWPCRWKATSASVEQRSP